MTITDYLRQIRENAWSLRQLGTEFERFVKQTRYQLKIATTDGAIEPLNEPLNGKLLRLVGTHPGTNLQYLTSVVSLSRATVKRAVAALVAAGKIEHRGSKKTGGYYAKKKVQF